MKLQHDKTISYAEGRFRRDKNWKNKETQWSDFAERVSATCYSAESYVEYMNLPKTRQDEIKDVGGFVGGTLAGGRRKHDAVICRSMLALDIDFGSVDIWDAYTLLYGNAALIYSTHKHSPERPRLRLVIPLAEEITRDQYEPAARMLAGDLGIDYFDDTTFEPSRLMYWPSTSKGGEYFFRVCDGPWLEPVELLSRYKDWTDATFWPQSSRTTEIIHREIKKQGDPLEKPGLIGAFCRSYTIQDAVESFLADEYESCGSGRFSYRLGSTTAGLVVYDDKFAYSHHGTDPAGGKLSNAFDLVRVHKFGLLDENTKEDTAHNRLPSYTAMVDFCSNDGRTKKLLVEEKLARASGDFEGVELEDDGDKAWMERLDADKKGNLKPTINNVVVIMENDRRIRGRLAFNEFEHREIMLDDLPWRKLDPGNPALTDSDDSSIRHFLESEYALSSKPKIDDGVSIIMRKNSYHPVKEYLNSCSWDGIKRVETLLIDYLGAADTALVRAMTRKALVAAVARIYDPGCKFDEVLTLIGNQGIGKSTLIKRLGGEWYSDSLDAVVGKDAYEQLQGVWLIELGELSGLKKAEIDQIKHFISKSEDRYRVAYGRRTENFKRQCVFFGTTNNREFLRDATGNRRFWPVDCGVQPVKVNLFTELTPSLGAQIWAECVVLYEQGEELFLPKELAERASEAQAEHMEHDERAGMIEAYLELELPESWHKMELFENQSFIHSESTREEMLSGCKSLFKRDKVCVAEIWTELFKGQSKDLGGRNSRELNAIMQRMPGWKKSQTRLRITGYGPQKGYTKE